MIDKTDLYQSVTDSIIAQIEGGTLPWLKPWKATAGVSGGGMFPCNHISGRSYSGVNVMILWSRAFSSNRWMTYKQAQSVGATVRKGEKGTQIVFASPRKYEDKATGEEKSYFFLKAYYVFNLDQIDGLPAQPVAAPVTEVERHATADAFIRATGARILHQGNEAYYHPTLDHIAMPVIGAFETPAHYYGTALHELIHWTGAKARLDRTFGKRFGDDNYAAEELVAEIGAAYACAHLGIEGKLRHADYVASWLKVLKADKRAIFAAASAASKAADHLRAYSEAETADIEMEEA
jgi:antirestriction protein ArdC